MKLFLISFGSLLSIMNPFGTMAIFVGLTKEHSKLQQHKIAFWTSVNVLMILLISFFFSKYILLFFGISLDSLKIAGGLIIASSSFAFLTGNFSKHKGIKKEKVKKISALVLSCRLVPLLFR